MLVVCRLVAWEQPSPVSLQGLAHFQDGDLRRGKVKLRV